MSRAAGIAIAAIGACAMTIWFADHLGATGGFRVDPSQFQLVVCEFYGTPGVNWLSAGGVAIEIAALLVLVWAAVRVAGRLSRNGAAGIATLAVIGATEVLVVAFCRDWGGIAEKIAYTGPLLLLVVYVLVTEAHSRISEDGTGAWWLRLWMPTGLTAVVLIPLLYNNFSAAAL